MAGLLSGRLRLAWRTMIDSWRRGAALLGAILLGVFAPEARATTPPQETPFKFAPMNVANPCLVDSVRFADTYLGGKRGGGARWVRVLRWGTLDDEYEAGPGHAVALFQWRGGLFVFDVNHGVRKLAVPVAQREDLYELTTAVFALYPEVRATGATLLDDSWTTRRPGLRGADAGTVTPGYRDAYRVAKTLAQHREVRLVRFTYREKGKARESGAAVFLFAGRFCVYVPERGTVVQKLALADLDDDATIRARLVRCFGREAEVRLVTGLPAEKTKAERAAAKRQ